MTGRRGRSSRVQSADLVGEALAGVLQRPARTALTVTGVALGIAAFVAILGITATATGQISKRFTELAATEVTVEDLTAADPEATGTAFPPDADARVLAIEGARHAGVFWTVSPSETGPVSAVELPGVMSTDQVPVVAASPGVFQAVRAQVAPGRPFDEALDRRAERVAVVGAVLARRLGIQRLDARPAVLIGGVPFVVIGVVADTARHVELLAAVWVPRHTAETLWPGRPDPTQPPRMVIDTRVGAAAVVAAQAALALRPDAPDSLRATAPPDPTQLRDDVNAELASLFLLLAGVCLVVGAVGIANTTLVAVMERVPEIGLRRSLGAQRRHIALQFLCESATVGAVGGAVAAGVGVGAVVLVAVWQSWTPILAPWTVVAAPALGAVTGLIAGLYPAIRASRIQPAEALRR